MNVHERATGDREQLRRLVSEERDAAQRDRYRAVVLAIDGRRTEEIIEMLDRSRGFVQRWVYAYRDGGLAALVAKKPPGKKAKVCEFRGRDIQHLLENEFGVKYSLNGVYTVLHRMGFSWLAPRPRHRQADPEAQDAFKASAPLL